MGLRGVGTDRLIVARESAGHVFTAVGIIGNVALVIIGCFALAGYFQNGALIGWITAGLGGGSCALLLLGRGLSNHKVYLILIIAEGAALVAIGVLGGLKILTISQLGWGIIGVHVAAFAIGCVIESFYHLRHTFQRLY